MVLRICVFDARSQPVFCPGSNAVSNEPASRRDAQGDNEASPHWKLFLRSDFDIEDWTLVSMETPAGGTSGAAPLATLSALVAAATLLFIGLLGLIQVRRTMVPLERLIAGTRRLSEHDYGARVALRPATNSASWRSRSTTWPSASITRCKLCVCSRRSITRSSTGSTSLACCNGSPIASSKWYLVPPLAWSNSTAARAC